LADATLAVQTKLTIARYGVWHLLLLYPCADELGFSRAVPVALAKGNITDEGAGPDIAMPVSIGVSIFFNLGCSCCAFTFSSTCYILSVLNIDKFNSLTFLSLYLKLTRMSQ
jgi:hypothetical protein